MAIRNTVWIGLVCILPGILTACGGGGGGNDSTLGAETPVPNTECFADYDSQQQSWDAFRSSKGHAVYSGNNGKSLTSLNLATGQISLISDTVYAASGSPKVSSSGRYIVYPTGGITSPVYDQEEGRVLSDLALVAVGSGEVNWAPDDTALLSKHILGSQIFSGPPLRNSDSILVADVTALAWSADSKLLATVDAQKLVIYERSPLRAVKTVPIAPGSPSPRYLSFDPTGRYLAYTTSAVPPSADFYQRDVHVLNLATLESSIIYSTPDVGGISPEYAWSPSGKFIALVGWDDEKNFYLQMYALDSQSTVPIARATTNVQFFQWAPASDALLFVRYESGEDSVSAHLVVDPASGKSKQVSASGLERIEAPAWSPDSRYFAYIAYDRSNDYRLYAGDSAASCYREVKLLANAITGPYGGATWSPSGQYLLTRESDGITVDHVAIRPDGSGRISLGPLAAPAGSTETLSDAQWTSASDTVYLLKVDAKSHAIKSISFLEIDSLGQTTVEANGVFGFADRVYLTQ